MTAKSLSKVVNNRVMFGLGNFTDQTIHLRNEINLGKIVCMNKHDKLVNLDGHSPKNKVCNIRSKSVIINVRENTDNKSLNEVEVAQLQNLVDKYSDVFVGKDGKLGKCSLLKHNIEVPKGT